jgi:hypothetical protein
MKILIILILLLGCAQTSQKNVRRDPATEVDNFSKRYLDIKDSTPLLNEQFSLMLI